MFKENKFHYRCLAIMSIGIACVTVYAIADPQVGNRQVADFDLPDEISLGSWQNLSSESLDISTERNETGVLIDAAKLYSYRNNGLNLSLEMRYLVGTRGNIASLLTEYVGFSPNLIDTQKIKTIPDFGSYLLIQKPNGNNPEHKHYSNYLSSCITPFGVSIAEQKEFSMILNQVKITPKLLWNWLWGKESLRDRRCLWINLEITNENRELGTSSEDLEQIWIELNRWGKHNFPKL